VWPFFYGRRSFTAAAVSQLLRFRNRLLIRKRNEAMKIPSITRNTDYLRAYRRAKSAGHPYVICYALPNRLSYSRLGLTASKKIGNAVTRNRARRVLRAAFTEVAPMLKPGWDIVLVARTQTASVKSTALPPILTAQLEKLGALQSKEHL